MADSTRRLRWHCWAVLLEVSYYVCGFGSRAYLRCVRGLSDATDWGEIPADARDSWAEEAPCVRTRPDV